MNRSSFQINSFGWWAMPTLPGLRRFAGHNFLGRNLNRLLRRLFNDAVEAMVFGLAQWPAFGQLHLVALLGFVLLIVGVNSGAAAEIFAVLGMLGLKVHHHGNRLISLVGGNNADDGPEHRARGRFGRGRRGFGGLGFTIGFGLGFCHGLFCLLFVLKLPLAQDRLEAG